MMIMIGLLFAVIAALIHVFIFYLESIAWMTQKARATFGISEEEARATKGMAFNQGFYNLFLALLVGIGAALFASGANAAGVALVFAGAGSMTAAALVLFLSSPDKRGAALKQGVIPALGVIALAIGVIV